MFRSRCSFVKPSSDDRCFRTRSPSSSVTGRPPISISLTSSTEAIVDLPEPDKPVKNTVTPCAERGGYERRSSAATAGGVNHAGSSLPSFSRRRCSVPEMFSTREASGTSSSGMYSSRFST